MRVCRIDFENVFEAGICEPSGWCSWRCFGRYWFMCGGTGFAGRRICADLAQILCRLGTLLELSMF